MAGIFRSTSSLWRGVAVGDSIHFTAHPDAFSRNLRNVSKISHFDMRNLAYKYLTRERVVTLIVEPYDLEEESKVEGEFRGF